VDHPPWADEVQSLSGYSGETAVTAVPPVFRQNNQGMRIAASNRSTYYQLHVRAWFGGSTCLPCNHTVQFSQSDEKSRDGRTTEGGISRVIKCRCRRSWHAYGTRLSSPGFNRRTFSARQLPLRGQGIFPAWRRDLSARGIRGRNDMTQPHCSNQARGQFAAPLAGA
jgi:hypothetical protein